MEGWADGAIAFLAGGGWTCRRGGDKGSGSIDPGLTYRTGSISCGIGAISVPSSFSMRNRLSASSR